MEMPFLSVSFIFAIVPIDALPDLSPIPAGSLHRALADERRALMILQRTGNDLCGRGRTAVDEDDDRFALGEVASRYRHPRYARSD